jgi:hypothetical protein
MWNCYRREGANYINPKTFFWKNTLPKNVWISTPGLANRKQTWIGRCLQWTTRLSRSHLSSSTGSNAEIQSSPCRSPLGSKHVGIWRAFCAQNLHLMSWVSSIAEPWQPGGGPKQPEGSGEARAATGRSSRRSNGHCGRRQELEPKWQRAAKKMWDDVWDVMCLSGCECVPN